MKTNDMHNHCPEVEALMGGKMPFVTRYGITIVLLVLLAVVLALCFSHGAPQQLMQDILHHTLEQIADRM